MKLQVGCVIYKFILLQTQLCITIFFTQACTGSCKLTWEDLKLLLDYALGNICTQITRILSLYTQLAKINMLWLSTLPIWMFMYEMFILVLRFTYLSFAAGARDCSRCSPLSRGSAPPLAQERKCVEGSSVLSPSRTVSLSLACAGIFRCKLHCSLTPTRCLTQILAWAACARGTEYREKKRERRPERSHTR